MLSFPNEPSAQSHIFLAVLLAILIPHLLTLPCRMPKGHCPNKKGQTNTMIDN